MWVESEPLAGLPEPMAPPQRLRELDERQNSLQHSNRLQQLQPTLAQFLTLVGSQNRILPTQDNTRSSRQVTL